MITKKYTKNLKKKKNTSKMLWAVAQVMKRENNEDVNFLHDLM